MDADPIEADPVESDGATPIEGKATAQIVDSDADSAETDAETDAKTDADAETTTDAETDGADAFEPLTITLPDGSESVSEAILSHRRMLTNPSDHGLVSADEAAEVRDALDTLSEGVPEDLHGELETLETSVEGMADRLDRQGRQIRELRETVTSLAEILGASVEFQTVDEDGA